MVDCTWVRDHSRWEAAWRPWRDSRLDPLLLYLLLSLLQFLQELLGCFHGLLPIGLLLRLLVVGGLVVRLVIRVCLIGLIVRLGVVGGVGGIIGGIVLAVLTLDHHRIAPCRSGHGRASIHVLGISTRLLHDVLRLLIARGRTARLGYEDDSVQSGRVGRRSEEKVIEVRSVEQQCQHITSWSWAEMSHDPLRRIARKLDGRTCLHSHCFQNVAQGGILGRNRQLASLE